MVRPVAAPADAIAYLSFCIGWAGGFVPIYLNGSREAHAYIRADASPRAGAKLARKAKRYDELESAQVEIGLPEVELSGGGPSQSTVLWAWVESRDSALRVARRFKPLPAVVLRMGSSCRRLCLWPLRELLPFALVESSNKRIAYALHSPQKYALPEALRIPLPGTFLRVGRARPAPVLATRLELDTWAREQLVGRLKDPPRPYMERLRAGEIPGRS